MKTPSNIIMYGFLPEGLCTLNQSDKQLL